MIKELFAANIMSFLCCYAHVNSSLEGLHEIKRSFLFKQEAHFQITKIILVPVRRDKRWHSDVFSAVTSNLILLEPHGIAPERETAFANKQN